MNNLKVFENDEFGKVRTVVVDGEPWFIAKDISENLGYAQTSNMMKRIDDEDSKSSVLDGMNMKSLLINESGLYSAIIGSKLSSAKKFKRWVTSEVLPSIRQTGTYTNKKMSAIEQLNLQSQAILEVDEKVEAVKSDLEEFKQDLPLLGCDMDRITTIVKRVGVKCLGGKNTPAYKDKSIRQKVYTDIYEQLKREFGVSTYKSIKRGQCDTAVQIVANYQLPMVLAEEINDCNAQEEMFV